MGCKETRKVFCDAKDDAAAKARCRGRVTAHLFPYTSKQVDTLIMPLGKFRYPVAHGGKTVNTRYK